jgi:hypothetical protein
MGPAVVKTRFRSRRTAQFRGQTDVATWRRFAVCINKSLQILPATLALRYGNLSLVDGHFFVALWIAEKVGVTTARHGAEMNILFVIKQP